MTKAKICFVPAAAEARRAALAATFELAAWEDDLGGDAPWSGFDADAYFAADVGVCEAERAS